MARMGEMRDVYSVWWGNLGGGDHLKTTQYIREPGV